MTVVYGFYNDDDEPIYVGVTTNLRARIAAHKRDKTWWDEVAYISELEVVDDRDRGDPSPTAYAIEQAWITKLSPRYNDDGLRSRWDAEQGKRVRIDEAPTSTGERHPAVAQRHVRRRRRRIIRRLATALVPTAQPKEVGPEVIIRQWHDACRQAHIVNNVTARDSAGRPEITEHFPRLSRPARIRSGIFRFTVRPAKGHTIDHLLLGLEGLETALDRVWKVRMTPHSDGTVTMIVALGNPWVNDRQPPRVQYGAGTFAIAETLAGEDIEFKRTGWHREPENMLIAGTVGSGKSMLLRNILRGTVEANDGTELWGVDHKNELALWASVFTRLAVPRIDVAPEAVEQILFEDTRRLVRDLMVVMAENYRVLSARGYGSVWDARAANDRRTLDRLRIVLFVIDEVQSVSLAKELQDVLGWLIQIGTRARAAGIQMVVATQTPSVKVIPSIWRDQLTVRWCGATSSAEMTRVVLKDHARMAPAHTLAPYSGHGYVHVDGRNAVALARSFLVTDEMIRQLTRTPSPGPGADGSGGGAGRSSTRPGGNGPTGPIALGPGPSPAESTGGSPSKGDPLLTQQEDRPRPRRTARRRSEPRRRVKVRRLHRPDHPLADRSGRVRENRLVLYDALGGADATCAVCHRPVRWQPGEGELELRAGLLDPDGEVAEGNVAPFCREHLGEHYRAA